MRKGIGNRVMTPAKGKAAAERVAAAMMCAAVVLAPAPRPGSSGGVPERPDRPVARARFLMGTRLSIETDGPAPAGALDAAFDEVARLERILSNWKPESEISRLNRQASLAPFRCSSDLYRAIRAALKWAKRTGGAFDPTVEPLVRALRLRPAEENLSQPGAGIREIGPGTADEVRLPIGWRQVRLREFRRSVRFDAPGVGLDLGGIGKGIALDAAARVLARHGVHNALLDFGGQVLAIGRPQGAAGWPIGIADPADRDTPVSVIQGADVSISTSGNGERAVDGPGGRIGHILDPRAQRPARFDGTVTAAAADATSADALSTALFVMGSERGTRWAEGRGIAALYLWREPDGTMHLRVTRTFAERFPGSARSLEH